MQKVRSLKPKTINRRLNTLKRFFEWTVQMQMVSLDVAKHLKLVPEETTSPRHMTDHQINLIYCFPFLQPSCVISEKFLFNIISR